MNEPGWLIERYRNDRTEWLGIDDPVCGVVADNIYFFTPNAHEALRFARGKDAEAFIEFIGLIRDAVMVTHHTFDMGGV
jgi:hypothetical protein